jgi:hypothetical protein
MYERPPRALDHGWDNVLHGVRVVAKHKQWHDHGATSGGSRPAAERADGGVARTIVKGDGVGATRNDVADRWAGTRRGPGRQRLDAARGSVVMRSARR